MRITNVKSLTNVFVIELLMFFYFMMAGIGMNRLLPVYSKDDSNTFNLLMIMASVFLIVFVSVVALPIILKFFIGDRKRAAGVGILYAFALLVGQKSFKDRVGRLNDSMN